MNTIIFCRHTDERERTKVRRFVRWSALFIIPTAICAAIVIAFVSSGNVTLTDGNVAVTGKLPQGAVLQVNQIESTQTKEFESIGTKVMFAYDIKITVDGEQWQPDEAVKVTVKSPKKIRSDITVHHVSGESGFGAAVLESISARCGGNTVKFETGSFSTFIGTARVG